VGGGLSTKRKEEIHDFTKTQKSKNSDLGFPLQQKAWTLPSFVPTNYDTDWNL
jgi:hypothetical protein